MIAERPDPSDLSKNTIQQLFFNQIRSLSVRPDSSVNRKMSTFDMQFSDAWF